jgi:release factor glutamine methyltransferase
LAGTGVVFLGLRLEAPPGTLAPRPETELLARTALEVLDAEPRPSPRIVDMCCGVGNLAVALAVRVPSARVWASDLTAACVAATRRNVAAYRLEARVAVTQGDLFAALAGQGLEGAVDLVVCNPPYISTGRLAGDRAHLLEHEPRAAFDAGPYGLGIHQRVVREAPAYLRPGGRLLMEFGEGQARQVGLLLERRGVYRDVRIVADAAGVARVAVARLDPEARAQ